MCCRKLVVMNRLSLGARELGWECYSLPKGEVLEFTTVQLRNLIKQGKDEVYGLKLAANGVDLEFDSESFFTTNAMNKVHINTLTPIVEDETMVNLFYVVIGTHDENGVKVFDVVSSRYERTSFTEEKVKTLLELHIISGGAKMENGIVIVAPLEKPKAVENKEIAKLPKISKGMENEKQ